MNKQFIESVPKMDFKKNYQGFICMEKHDIMKRSIASTDMFASIYFKGIINPYKCKNNSGVGACTLEYSSQIIESHITVPVLCANTVL